MSDVADALETDATDSALPKFKGLEGAPQIEHTLENIEAALNGSTMDQICPICHGHDPRCPLKLVRGY